MSTEEWAALEKKWRGDGSVRVLAEFEIDHLDGEYSNHVEGLGSAADLEGDPEDLEQSSLRAGVALTSASRIVDGSLFADVRAGWMAFEPRMAVPLAVREVLRPSDVLVAWSVAIPASGERAAMAIRAGTSGPKGP